MCQNIDADGSVVHCVWSCVYSWTAGSGLDNDDELADAIDDAKREVLLYTKYTTTNTKLLLLSYRSSTDTIT